MWLTKTLGSKGINCDGHQHTIHKAKSARINKVTIWGKTIKFIVLHHLKKSHKVMVYSFLRCLHLKLSFSHVIIVSFSVFFFFFVRLIFSPLNVVLFIYGCFSESKSESFKTFNVGVGMGLTFTFRLITSP